MMVHACTPQGEPILGTGGEKKYVHWFRMPFLSHPAEGVEFFKECIPVMVAFRFF